MLTLINLIQWIWPGANMIQQSNFYSDEDYWFQRCSSSSSGEYARSDDFLIRWLCKWDGIARKWPAWKKGEVLFTLKTRDFILLQQKLSVRGQESQLKLPQVRIWIGKRRTLWRKDCFSKKLSESRRADYQAQEQRTEGLKRQLDCFESMQMKPPAESIRCQSS